mmetsp:Transcript_27029/g.76165  ORF Transcript_27029/g.76165 Transcript_27029/m.76165 type:complete len:309 (-) Transcript_27029:351-1277(-)
MFPKGEIRRLAVDATLRASAPLQLARHRRLQASPMTEAEVALLARGGRPRRHRRVVVEKDDLRVKKLARKAGKLIVFVVDASGSMALNRMAAAKGAALSILAESYKSRNQVAIVPFWGTCAPCIVPPTRAVALARRRLEVMPCGGGTPMAQGLASAVRVVTTARKRGEVGQAVAVLITDGRANVPLRLSIAVARDGGAEQLEGPHMEGSSGGSSRRRQADHIVVSESKEEMAEEVLTMARRLAAAGIDLVVIDTESKFLAAGSLGQRLAEAACGTYFRLPVLAGRGAGAQLLLQQAVPGQPQTRSQAR